MNAPELATSRLKQTRAWEYAVRFAFGGAITIGTGVIGKLCGPLVAGLFLAFPAILPASVTLVKQHDGRRDAIDDARGARLGSFGLAAFAVTVAVSAGSVAPASTLDLQGELDGSSSYLVRPCRTSLMRP